MLKYITYFIYFLLWVVQVDPNKIDWTKIFCENYEIVEKILRTNYFGTKEFTTVLIPLLQSSTSPKIINVSSSIGRLEVRISQCFFFFFLLIIVMK